MLVVIKNMMAEADRYCNSLVGDKMFEDFPLSGAAH